MFAAGNYFTVNRRGQRGRVRRGGQRDGRGRGRGRGRESNEDAVGNGVANVKISDEIPEELIEPCKVYVGNLRPRVSHSCYA